MHKLTDWAEDIAITACRLFEIGLIVLQSRVRVRTRMRIEWARGPYCISTDLTAMFIGSQYVNLGYNRSPSANQACYSDCCEPFIASIHAFSLAWSLVGQQDPI